MVLVFVKQRLKVASFPLFIPHLLLLKEGKKPRSITNIPKQTSASVSIECSNADSPWALPPYTFRNKTRAATAAPKM